MRGIFGASLFNLQDVLPSVSSDKGGHWPSSEPCSNGVPGENREVWWAVSLLPAPICGKHLPASWYLLILILTFLWVGGRRTPVPEVPKYESDLRALGICAHVLGKLLVSANLLICSLYLKES